MPIIFIFIIFIFIFIITYTIQASAEKNIIYKIREAGYTIDTCDNTLNKPLSFLTKNAFYIPNILFIEFAPENHLIISNKIISAYNILSPVPLMASDFPAHHKFGDWYFYSKNKPIIKGPFKHINIIPMGHYCGHSSFYYFRDKTGTEPKYRGNQFLQPTNINFSNTQLIRLYMRIQAGDTARYHSFIIDNADLYSSWYNIMQFRFIKKLKNINEFLKKLFKIKDIYKLLYLFVPANAFIPDLIKKNYDEFSKATVSKIFITFDSHCKKDRDKPV